MKIPSYDEQLLLVKKGYAKKSTNGHLDTFKYSRKVMYDYLWNELKDEGILECRGHTYDNRNGNLVSLPLTKSFNYLENDTWKDVSLNTRVFCCKKYNGYMLAATKYNDELVVSTTGTTNSNYVKFAVEKYSKDLTKVAIEGLTDLYEVVDNDFDPHIVEEKSGLYHLGYRINADISGFWQPYNLKDALYCSLGEVLELSKTNKSEGWMVYINNMNFCKIKTEYYIGKKKLMRMRNTDLIWDNPRTVENLLPSRWKNAVEWIREGFTKGVWKLLTEQQRRFYLEQIEDLIL